MSTNEFDVLVIGSGQGGNPLASRLAKEGERVALVERGNLGGTCINTGCTPTKMYVASAQVAHYARQARRWGVHASDVSVDLSAVRSRTQAYVEKSRNSWEKTFAGAENLELIRGSASFTGERTVQVNGRSLTAKKIFIDTGSATTIPELAGLEGSGFLTNESLLHLTDVPKKLVVLGAGYVGLEFAQVFHRFGSAVAVIGNSRHVLPHEDEDVSESLEKALAAEGIEFFLNSRAIGVERRGETITVKTASGQQISGSHLLLAVGRTPSTKDLDLERGGIKVDAHGYIQVDDELKTTAEGVWAIGDVKGGPAFTHISYDDFQLLYGNLYEGKQLRVSQRIVPYAVFTDPELGRVGMTEREAREAGYSVKVGSVPMTRVARAIERDETAGLMKIVVDAKTDLVLGAAILSSTGGEDVQILHTLMLAGQPYTLLKGAIYIHPTMAEGFFALMEAVA